MNLTQVDYKRQRHEDLSDIIERFQDCIVLVIGDIMLDIYRIGEATRISPEAPVPVLLNPTTEYHLGGAGAVAAMCAALGAEVFLTGILGDDANGRHARLLLDSAGVRFIGVTTKTRVTTTKERICGVASGRHRQQLGRVDCEDASPISADLAAQLASTMHQFQRDPPDIILASDYAKGVCVAEVLNSVRRIDAPALVDPPKHRDWELYRGWHGIVPNREEANGQSAAAIRSGFGLEAAIVKLDEQGCAVSVREDGFEIGGEQLIPARKRALHDVTGAGDQFLTVLGCARASGADWFTAAELANVAAGLQVERHGCTPVTVNELRAEM